MTWSRLRALCVLTCMTCSHAYFFRILDLVAGSRACVFSCLHAWFLRCMIRLRACMGCMLVLLKRFTSLHLCMLPVIAWLICFIFQWLSSKNVATFWNKFKENRKVNNNKITLQAFSSNMNFSRFIDSPSQVDLTVFCFIHWWSSYCFFINTVRFLDRLVLLIYIRPFLQCLLVAFEQLSAYYKVTF